MRLIFKVCFVCAAACAPVPPVETDIEYSASWFACDSRFDCIVVYDAFCKHVAVNSRYTLVYQDWSRQEATREGERVVCADLRLVAGGAGCREGRCVYPFGLEDYVDKPTKDERDDE